RAESPLGQRGELQLARPGRLHDRRHAEPAGRDRRVHGGRHDPLKLALKPGNRRRHVTNTQPPDPVRLEGPGAFSTLFKPPGEPASVRGHLVESRVTVLDGPNVTPRHLNKHIDYGTCCAAAPNTESEASLAFPLGMAVSSDGLTLYVAG